MKNKTDQLRLLYEHIGKHSNYQVLSPLVTQRFPELVVKQTISRFEQERLDAISQNIQFSDTDILDVGGNTGFFSIEALVRGAANVTYVEGNPEHYEFVRLVSECLNISHKLSCQNEYLDFTKPQGHFDIIFLLNVLHHIGDDYGIATDIPLAKEYIKTALSNLATNTDTLIFQIGFNWQGNVKTPLFHSGTKREMIDWVANITAPRWEIKTVLIAEKNECQSVKYAPLTSHNILRNDELGEFLNRPIFILESKI